jgi:MOSC domain-containing protein YiiM
MHKPKPTILSINISKGGIPKLPVQFLRLNIDGFDGDGHNHEKHRTPIQAVCLQDIEKLNELREEGYSLEAGTTGENLTMRDLNVNHLPIGTILRFSSGVLIELTKDRKPCYVLDAINPKLKEDIVGRCGMYATVLQEGTLITGIGLNPLNYLSV